MVVLKEILLSSIRAGDPLAAWSAAARLLRSYYPLITPAGQSGLASALLNSSERLPSGTRCADPALPFIRYLLTLYFLNPRTVILSFLSYVCTSHAIIFHVTKPLNGTWTFCHCNLGFSYLLGKDL